MTQGRGPSMDRDKIAFVLLWLGVLCALVALILAVVQTPIYLLFLTATLVFIVLGLILPMT